jgi:hypothetical protein
MNLNFGEVLSGAWQIVWKRRVLWIFGILAGCSSRGGSNFNWNMGNGSGGGGSNGVPPNLPPEMIRFFQYFAENWQSFVAILLAVICIIWIVTNFLGTIGRIGLIRGTWQAETGGNLVFGPLFSESMPYFWRVFGLSLVVGIPFLVLTGAAVAGFLAFGAAASQVGNSEGLGFLALMPFLFCCLCLLVPIGIVVNLILRQSERAIVLENAGILQSLSRGWEIFRSNLGPILLMALILWVIGLVVGFVIAIPVLIVAVPATFAFIAGGGSGPNWNALYTALACMCLLTPFLWLINGILTAYIESSWTLTYMQITRPVDSQPVVIEANA